MNEISWFYVLAVASCFASCLGQFNCDTYANSGKSMEFVTYGGTVPSGTPCCFPFLYKDQLYNQCTKADHTQEWCAVVSVYRDNELKRWGNCERSPTYVPPTVSTLIPVYSCSAFADSARSQEYITTGGTVATGTPCCFPFIYRNQAYYQCTTADHNQEWCGVDSIYENNRLWGNCRLVPTPAPTPAPGPYSCSAFTNSAFSQRFITWGGTVPLGTPCCFPFNYNGEMYTSCTTRNHVRLWCAVESVYRESDRLWGNCEDVSIVASSAPTTSPDQFVCNAFSNSTRSSGFFTRGGTVPPGTSCCFPFVYRNQVYNECTRVNHNQPWCAVESFYQENRKLWGNCQ